MFGLAKDKPHIIFLPKGGDVLHPTSVSPNNPEGIYEIMATGSHAEDRAKLLAKLNLTNAYGYHNHHIDYNSDTNIMRVQLVNSEYHNAINHIGGANDFKRETGFEYNSDEAIVEANRRKEKINKQKGYKKE